MAICHRRVKKCYRKLFILPLLPLLFPPFLSLDIDRVQGPHPVTQRKAGTGNKNGIWGPGPEGWIGDGVEHHSIRWRENVSKDKDGKCWWHSEIREEPRSWGCWTFGVDGVIGEKSGRADPDPAWLQIVWINTIVPWSFDRLYHSVDRLQWAQSMFRLW